MKEAGYDVAAGGRRDGDVVVLVVEDDPLVREAVAMLIESDGYRVIASCDGDECLDRLPPREKRVVLVTDVILPGRSGRALADEVRRRRPRAPVVFATGLPDAAYSLEPLGVNETVLLKPFGVREIAHAVGRAALAA
ncbi:MAG: response regulator [Alphaproteobacteria bacterium]|nr:response regulator [Alphaproteobacteria bacterium]